MKYWIIALLMVLVGCEYEEKSGDELDRHTSSYSDWMSRESWSPKSLSLTPVPDIENNRASINATARWVASRVTYSRDGEKYGRDYWQSSDETLSLGHGDCEDIAILNYVVLSNLGYNENQMDCFIVNSYENDQYKGCHCIIGFYVDGYVDQRILNGPGIMILEEDPLVEYEIVFVFNRSGIYLWQG